MNRANEQSSTRKSVQLDCPCAHPPGWLCCPAGDSQSQGHHPVPCSDLHLEQQNSLGQALLPSGLWNLRP